MRSGVAEVRQDIRHVRYVRHHFEYAKKKNNRAIAEHTKSCTVNAQTPMTPKMRGVYAAHTRMYGIIDNQSFSLLSRLYRFYDAHAISNNPN